MTQVQFYGRPLPGVQEGELPGRLIVIEGPDGVGRSTQTALLREWLEANGFAVFSSGLKRSELAAQGIADAKEGHTLGQLTMALFYAADFADRLEREIIPALRAGFVVLTDRYIYSLMARSLVRGVDPQWIRSLYGCALIPDAVFFLRCSVTDLIPRVLGSRGFDFWESGLDFLGTPDYFEGYTEYQRRMLATFTQLGHEYGFVDIDATQGIRDTFIQLQEEVKRIVVQLKPSHKLDAE
jgi:dTMP kinase